MSFLQVTIQNYKTFNWVCVAIWTNENNFGSPSKIKSQQISFRNIQSSLSLIFLSKKRNDIFSVSTAFPAKAIDIYFFFVQNQIPAKSLETVKFMLFTRPWILSWNRIFFRCCRKCTKAVVPKLSTAKLISSSRETSHYSKWTKYTFSPIFFTNAWLLSLSHFSVPRNFGRDSLLQISRSPNN